MRPAAAPGRVAYWWPDWLRGRRADAVIAFVAGTIQLVGTYFAARNQTGKRSSAAVSRSAPSPRCDSANRASITCAAVGAIGQVAQAFWGSRSYGLLDYRVFKRMDVLQASGVGGGSLVYSNVIMRAPFQAGST